MTSIKAKIIIGLMRNRHLLQGRLRKETMPHSIEAVLAFRESCEKGAKRFGKLPEGVSTKQELINMVLTEWIIPDGAPKDKLIFYVHGGGYVSGSCADHRAVVAKLAKQTGIIHLQYEYGLAPEHPFPAAIDDSLSVYRAVLEQGYKPGNIIARGESAGGGLCLALLIALRDKKIPLPKAAVALTPWADLSCTAVSYQTKNKLSLAPLNCWNVFSKNYAGQHDVKHPYISPLYGNLEGLPPIYLNVGDSDELYDDGIKFFEKARHSDLDITLKEGRGMIHCYPLLAPLFPEATEAMDEIVTFIHQHLNP